MYVLATRDGAFRMYSTTQLYEVATKAEMIDLAARYDHVRKIPPSEAHRWVRDGGIHNTYLYIDQGRIRRAGPEK